MVGIAVKVTLVPAQMESALGLAEILTEGITVAVTVMVTVFDVAVAGMAHGAFDVISQEIERASCRERV